MKYLLALFGDESRYAEATPEQRTDWMAAWDGFTKATIDAGVHLGGEGLQPSATATKVEIDEGGTPVVSDGPFAETKEQLAGYYLLDCADLDDVLAWAKRIPMPGGTRGDPAGDGLREPGLRGAQQRGGGRAVGPPAEEVDRLFRRESGRAVATLIRVLGDFDLAEEAVQDAFVVALERWPRDGVPAQPGGWIVATARNGAIDRLRRSRRYEQKLAELAALGRGEGAEGEKRT